MIHRLNKVLTRLKIEITSSREDKAPYETSRSRSLLDTTSLGSDKEMLKNRPTIYKIN